MENDGDEILFVGKSNEMCQGDPDELSEAEKEAKKEAWRHKMTNIRCALAPMVDQRFVLLAEILNW